MYHKHGKHQEKAPWLVFFVFVPLGATQQQLEPPSQLQAAQKAWSLT